MLTRPQIHTLLMLRNRALKNPNDNAYSLFSQLPVDLIREISTYGRDDTEFNQALRRYAASATKEDIAKVVEMVKANPRLLLQSGNVVTRGGVDVRYTTLYEFFLAEGDPEAAKQIEPYFAEILNGENERKRQYERLRPHIEALAKQLKSKQPTYDLKPLIDLIVKSKPEDIQAALKKDMSHKSELSKALTDFRNAVKPKRKTVGLHYEHYTTLIQAFDLLDDEWEKLSNNGANYDKCRLVWRQVIGYLQRSLPAVDRFAFARAFDDTERTPNFKYGNGSFPDAPCENSDFTGLGFDEAMYGQRRSSDGYSSAAWVFLRVCLRARVGKHMSSKSFRLAELMQRHPKQKPSGCVIC